MHKNPHLNVGGLSLGTSGFTGPGKLIDTWEFKSPDHKEKPSKAFSVSIYMKKQRSGASAAISFEAVGDAVPANSMIDSDLDRLRQRVEDHLREQWLIQQSAVWSPWLEVMVTGKRDDGSRSFYNTANIHLTVSYRPILRGTRESDPGKAYTINSNGVAVPFPTPEQAETERLRIEDAEFAYVPDTPDNRLALTSVFDSIAAAQKRLRDLLSQNNINDTSRRLREGLAALPIAIEAE